MKTVKQIILVFGFFFCMEPILASANTANSSWGFCNYSGVSYTSYRTKDTRGNVYCAVDYSYLGASVDVTVGQGGMQVSRKVRLYQGKQYTIVNSARSNAKVRLKFNSTNIDSTYNNGWWSPDASRDYNIVG